MKKTTLFNSNLLTDAILVDLMLISSIFIDVNIIISALKDNEPLGDALIFVLPFVLLTIFLGLFFHLLLKVHKGYIRIILSGDKSQIKSVLFWKTLKSLKPTDIKYIYIINTGVSYGINKPYLIFSENEINTKRKIERKLPIMYGHAKDYIPMRITKENYNELKLFLNHLGVKIINGEYNDLIKLIDEHGIIFIKEREDWNCMNLIDQSLIIKNT